MNDNLIVMTTISSELDFGALFQHVSCASLFDDGRICRS